MKMRFVLAAVLAFTFSAGAQIGEDVIGSKCKVSATSPSTGSTGGDTDCVWDAQVMIKMQCDGAVHYTRDNSTPDTDSPKVAVGDPYPIRTIGTSTAKPIKFLPVSGTANCNFYSSKI